MSSGNGVKPDEDYDEFICLECEEIFSISQQFEGKPICVNCAGASTAAEVLENERQQPGDNIQEDLDNEPSTPVAIETDDIDSNKEASEQEPDSIDKNKEFLCVDCGKTYTTDFQFEDKPICVTCVAASSTAEVLENERQQPDDNIQEDLDNEPSTPVAIETDDIDSSKEASEQELDSIDKNTEFLCVDCGKTYTIDMQYEDKPLCINCVSTEKADDILSEEKDDVVKAEQVAMSNINDLVDTQQATMAIDDNNKAAGEQMKARSDLNITEADWVDLPAGNFLMGSSLDEEGRGNDERLHRVDVAAIKMMSKPVTFDQYDIFCFETGKEQPSDKGWGRENHPVIYVSYWDAVDYAKWLSEKTGWVCRLPTEAEWEYACRASTKADTFNVGDSITCAQSNFDGLYLYKQDVRGISRWRTLPVGSFPANDWGLYDMHGNVWEWCASEYDFDYSGLEMMDSSFDRMNRGPRTLRGGSWHSRSFFLRSACRYRFGPDECSQEWGFRLVRTD